VYVSITGAGKARVIQFREDTRIPGTTKKKTRVIKTLGNYERMLACFLQVEFPQFCRVLFPRGVGNFRVIASGPRVLCC